MKISRNLRLQFSAIILLAALVCPVPTGAQKPDRSIEVKIDELLGQLTLDEKVSMLAGTGFDTVPVPRLGIPALKMTDGPVGVRQAPATSFPSGIALAASFDPALIGRVAAAIAEETKAKGKNVLLGPCVNIQRTPFGGRNFESFGEDPFLAARMAVAYIRGMQSENVIPSVKHFAANNQEIDRMTIDVRVDERALNELYFPAFRASVEEAGVWSVMASYNRLNGFYASENEFLLNETLKKRWNFQGLVMSDWGAVHSTVPTLRNGLDLEMPTGSFLNPEAVKKALAAGEIDRRQLDEMVRRLLRVMFWAGLMDGKTPDKGALDTPAHRALAREAATGGIVLLKNERAALPIDAAKTRSIAVIGPNADAARIGGGGSAEVVPVYKVSPLEGLKTALGDRVRIDFAPGIVALDDTTPVPASALTTPDGRENGLRGEYFANMTLAGAPAFTRTDATLDFHWATGAPAENFPSDLFSNRWTGFLTAPETGRYALSLASNDGGRLYLDDKLVVDVWGDHATLKGAAAVELRAGERHKILIEHYENRGNADLVLGWRRLPEDILEKAVAAARSSDVAVVFVGLSDSVEVEARDRASLDLPADQKELIAAVARANPRTIVVNTSGGPVLMDGWLDKVPAVVQAFYYGQEGGNALADVLLGRVSPSGRLPATFLRRWEDSNAFGRYPGDGKTVDYSEGVFVGYRWFDSKSIAPLFPFGHGLSYTTFKYSNLKLAKTGGANLDVTFTLENTGGRDGAEVAQVYVGDTQSSLPRPPRELKGFQKVFLKAGEKKTVTIALDRKAFAFYDPAKQSWTAEPGDFRITVGGSSRDARLTGAFRLDKAVSWR
ncbi:MAG: glycoside hydrolase family 3 C-terminal domain-containing protein [Acidobacteria bacterium]|nr:glycoside hydrolase family 3 C-terminal domain-containing protein [Acidobacteriota bacterium]